MNVVRTGFETISSSIPEFCRSHWLLRIPLSIILIQQGLSKFPLTVDDAASFELPFTVWAMAAFSELFVGVSLILGGILRGWYGDLLTRLGGIVLAAVIAGVIITTNWGPIFDIILYDHLHVLLLVGGLYFGLRGNRVR